MKKTYYLFTLFLSVFFLGACSSSDNDKNTDPENLKPEEVIAKLQGRWKSVENGTTWFYQFNNKEEGFRFQVKKEMNGNEFLIQHFEYSYSPLNTEIRMNVWLEGKEDDDQKTEPTLLTFEIDDISDNQIEVEQNNKEWKWNREKIGDFKSIVGEWKEVVDENEEDAEITTLTFKENGEGTESNSYDNEKLSIKYKFDTKQGVLTYDRFYGEDDFESEFFIILQLTDNNLKLLSPEGIESYKK